MLNVWYTAVVGVHQVALVNPHSAQVATSFYSM